MFLFLLIFNIVLSFAVSQDVVYVDDDFYPTLRELKKGEIKGVFYCLRPNRTDNNTLRRVEEGDPEEPEYHQCRKENTNCTDVDYDEELCQCKKEWATREGDALYCDYKRKKQLTAFLLELFVGFGSAHFYRGEYLIASLKLVAFLFGIYIICLFPLTVKCFDSCCESDCCIVMVSLFFFLCSVGLAFWFIFDLVRFGKNKYPDKNGISLMHW